MPGDDDAITVTRNDGASRYEIRVGDVLAGFTEFERTADGEYLYPHTEIDHAFRGRGLAGELVAEAMADAAQRGERVVPLCPVVRRYLREHTVEGLDVDWSAASTRGSLDGGV